MIEPKKGYRKIGWPNRPRLASICWAGLTETTNRNPKQGSKKTMPKAKKSMKLRDQKPAKDPRGGGHKGHGTAHLNTAGTEGNKNQRHRHGGDHSHF
jgi:hypothetical protein